MKTSKQFAITIALTLTVGIAYAGTQARITGVVRNTSGEPVPAAVVTISCPEQPAYKKVVSLDEDGAFRVLLLDATFTYIFHIDAEGYVGHDEEFKVPIGTMDNLYEFELKTEGDAAAKAAEKLLEQPGYKEMEEARIALGVGDSELARTHLAAAVAAAPGLVAAWEHLAELDFDAGDTEAALKHAEMCLDEDDESVRCLAVAANAAQGLGDTGAYEDYLARYQALNPDDPASIFNQAVVFLNASDDEQARPLLERCLEVDPDFAKCLFEYGMVLLRSGDTEGAKQHLNHYLEVHPDGDDAGTAAEVAKYL